MIKKTGVLCVLYTLVSAFGIAQQEQKTDSLTLETLEEVVVSDTRFKLKRENSGKAIIKISKQEIERNQGRTVAQLINTKSGIEINGSRSNPGQNLGVFVRGGRNRQVLVIVDGIQISDPSQLSGEYDLRLLSLGSIESIEIIKGAASTLYGSGAATAVINITTKEATEQPINALLSSTIGTNQNAEDQNYSPGSFVNAANLSGRIKRFSYKIAFNHQLAEGLSSAISAEDENDPYSKYAIDINMGYQFNKALTINVYGNLTDINSSFDGGAFLDASNTFDSDQERIGITSKYKYNKGSVSFNAAYSDYSRDFISDFPSNFESNNFIADAYNKYVFNKTFYTIVGINVINNNALFSLEGEEQDFNSIDPYINIVYVSNFGLNVNTGGRLNSHSDYGTNFTYNVNPSYVFKFNEDYFKAFTSYSTSFITPSLSQLFGNFGPNPDLLPEENRTIEGGVEVKLGENLRITALYFNREEKNIVSFVGNGYLNVADRLNTQGSELEINASPIKRLTLSANYTFVENKEEIVVRIPKHKVNLLVGYDFTKRTFASLSYNYTDDRLVNDFSTFPAEKVILEPFSLVNFTANHALKTNENIKFSLGIDNILNEEYSDVLGFTSLGRNVRAGVQISL